MGEDVTHRPRGTLYLHIGTHKTGTTSFQRVLSDLARDHEMQTRLGLLPWTQAPDAPHQTNAHRLAHAILRGTVMTPMRLRDQATPVSAAEKAALLSEAASRLAARDQDDMILSAEAFCLCRTEAEMRVVTDLVTPVFARVVVLLCLREVGSWRRSREGAKPWFHTNNPFADLPDAQSAFGDWYYDHAAISEAWQTVGDLRVIDYDHQMRVDGSILPALFRSMDRADHMPKATYWLNQAPQLATSERG